MEVKMEKSNLITLDDLFLKSFFVIPDYQRGYSWEQKQINEFYEDLLIIMHNEENHYTGLLSLEEISKEEMSEEYFKPLRWLKDNLRYTGYYIVDGQQRLTTCIIFINEILKYIKKLEHNKNLSSDKILINKESIKDIEKKYLFDVDPELNIIASFKFGYLCETMNQYFSENIICLTC